jgi:hypothetical protein
MEKRSLWSGILLTAAVGLLGPPAQAKIGVGTQFTDAVMENLEPGQSYNVRELRGLPYSVRNAGDVDQDVKIEVSAPARKDLKPEYEPIPDPTWVQLLPDQHRLPPGGTAFSDILISIPDDPRLAGRHFQAEVLTHTVGEGMFGTGVKSRIRFSVGPGPQSLAQEKKRKAMVSLNYDLWPGALYVTEATAGAPYDVKKREKKSFKITNRSEESFELVLKAVPWDKRFPPPEGFEPVAIPQGLTLKPERVRLKPNRVEEIKVVLNLPEETRGRNLVFLIQAALPVGTVVSSAHRVHVTVLGEKK